MRHGLEAHRRNRPYCMGTMYWQLNDSWPVVSWSGIDYFGNWKALHYHAKRAFAPILINPIQEGDSLNIYLISDKLETLDQLTLEMRLIDFDGKVLNKKAVKSVRIPGNTSLCVHREFLETLLSPEQQKQAFVHLTLKDKGGREIAEENYFFVSPKDMNLPEAKINYKVKQQDGYCEITLNSSKLAKDVFIQIPVQGARFSDNFFDLLPGVTKKITITAPLLKKEGKANITIKHIRETYK